MLAFQDRKTVTSAPYRVKRGKDETLNLKAARKPPAKAVLFIAPKGRSPVAR